MRREAENRAEKFIKKRLLKKRLAGMLLVLSLIVGSVTMYMLKHSAVAVSYEAAEEVGMVMEGENDSDGGEEIVVEEMENEQAEENSAEETDGSESHGSEPEQNEVEESDENSVAEESSNEENKENSDETSGEEVTEDSNEESSEESASTEEQQESSEVSLEAGAEKHLESSGADDSHDSTVSDNSSEESEEKESTEDREKQAVSANEASGEEKSQEKDAEKAVSDNTASDEAASDDSDEKSAVSDNNTEKESASDNSVSNNDAKDDSTSDNGVSNNRAEDNSVSDNSVSDNSVSNNSVSGNSVSDDSVSKNAVKTEYVYEDSKVKVVATLERADAIPDDAEFKVTEVTKTTKDYNYDAYMDALNEGVSENKVSENGAVYNEKNTLLYDIAFMVDKRDENGNVIEGEKIEYQPEEGSVNIKIEFLDKQLSKISEDSSSDEVEIKHLPLEDEVKKKVDTTAEAKNIEASDIKVESVSDNSFVDGKNNTAEFTVDSFSVYSLSTTQANFNDRFFVFKNYTKNGYKDEYYQDSSQPDFGYANYFDSNLALGTAGNFHIVAFNDYRQNVDVCGNILVNNFYSQKDFGSRKINYELSYIQNIKDSHEGDLTKLFYKTVLAIGNSNSVDNWANNGASIRINGKTAYKPQLIIRDENASKPFISISDIKKEISDISKKLSKNDSANVAVWDTTDDEGQLRKVTYFGSGKAGYLSFNWSTWNSFVAGKRLVFDFPEYHEGQSIIINIDCKGADKISFPNKASEIYVNGSKLENGETSAVKAGRVVYNFYNASGKEIYLQKVFGQVIAMGATLEVNKGDGNFIAENVTISGETHRRDFVGTTDKDEPKEYGDLRIHKMVVNDFGAEYVRDGKDFALLSNVSFRITNNATGNYIVFTSFTGRAGDTGTAVEYDGNTHKPTGNEYVVTYNQGAQWTIAKLPKGVYTVEEVGDEVTFTYSADKNLITPVKNPPCSRVTKYDLTADDELDSSKYGYGGQNYRRVFSRDLDERNDRGPTNVLVGYKDIGNKLNKSNTQTVQVCNYYSAPLAPLAIKKCFSGGEWGEKDVFEFKVEAVEAKDTHLSDIDTKVTINKDDIPMPEKTSIKLSGKDASLIDGKYYAEANFGNIYYTYEGTYVYKITEVQGSDSSIAYDTNVYYVEVKVKKCETTFSKKYSILDSKGSTHIMNHDRSYYEKTKWAGSNYKYSSDGNLITTNEIFWYLGADEIYYKDGSVLAECELRLNPDLDPDTANVNDMTYVFSYKSGNVITFNNKRTASIKIKKEWIGSDGKEIKDTGLFSPVFIQLYRYAPKANESKLINTYTLSAENGWQVTVDGLDKFYSLNGRGNYGYTYSIKEVFEKSPGEFAPVETNVKYEYIGGSNTCIRLADDKPEFVMICKNTRSDYVLPATGGIGTTPIRSLGMGIMIVAIMGIAGIFFGNKKYLG